VRAVVIQQYGGPEQLVMRELPEPEPLPGHVVIDVKAFGLNHAEIYFRSGAWGDVAPVTGIECVGAVKADPDGRFKKGQKVEAVVLRIDKEKERLSLGYKQLTRDPWDDELFDHPITEVTARSFVTGEEVPHAVVIE